MRSLNLTREKMQNKLISRCRMCWWMIGGFGLICGFPSHLPCLILTRSPYSSQSVARLNTHWSNDILPATKRRRDAGFGGREDLERTRKYRDEEHRERHGGYGMVFDVEERGKKRRSRSRSRSGERKRRDADRDWRRHDRRR